MQLTNEHYRMAKVAYDGYCKQTGFKSLATGDDLPEFEALRPAIKDAWCAAAIALSIDIEIDARRSPNKASTAFRELKRLCQFIEGMSIYDKQALLDKMDDCLAAAASTGERGK